MQEIRKQNLLSFFILFLILLFSGSESIAQGFGQNKVQYKEFNWKFIRSQHFDIYFYQGGKEIAEFAADEVEKSYDKIVKAFKWKLSRRGILIIYNSHNEFQQTNVVQSYMPEGVGGVTELFKNRVVVPFEGDYAGFRHVIGHELVHAVMNDMLYGGNIQALVTSRATQVPIWFAEGLAEFLSVGWDNRIDMLVRDVLVNSTVEKERILYGLPYHFGTSLFKYITQQYGYQKISEILHKIRGSISFNAAMEAAIGIPLEDLFDDWYGSLKKEYWPDISNRQEPKDQARQITGTDKSEKREIFKTFVYGPSVSPNGDKIAYILNQDLTKGVFIQSLISGNKEEIVEGETESHFEELHILTPGLSFSPDGRYLSFSAKGGDADVIHIYDTFEEEIQTLRFNLDGIFGASWSPNGRFIAFRGVLKGFADIYIYDLQQKLLMQITNDKFDDLQPSWTPDSKALYFVSDRGSHLVVDSVGAAGYNMSAIKDFYHDIYRYDFVDSKMERITNSKYEERNPIVADRGRKLLYISDENGVLNIFVMDIKTKESHAITNFYDGVESISWSEKSQQLVFSSFSRMNKNAFILRDPFEIKPKELADVTNIETRGVDAFIPEKLEKKENLSIQNQKSVHDYRNYVFGKDKIKPRESIQDLEQAMNLPDKVLRDSSGNYIVNKYKLKFTPDLINGIVGYDTYYGVQGYTQMLFSDVLGDHQIMAGTNLVFDLRNSDIIFQYLYLPNRVDFGISAYHLSDLFIRRSRSLESGYQDYLVRFRTINLGFDAFYPISKFTRIQGGIQWRQVTEENLTDDTNFGGDIHTTIFNIGYVRDYSQWWYFAGPVKGLRYNLSLSASPKIKEDSKEFYTFKYDFRKYFSLGLGYSLAIRASGGFSTGESPQNFFLGGISNWLNPSFKGGKKITTDDIYFSEFVTPLRGSSYYELIGNNYFISNIEFRFPFMLYLGIGFLPIQLSGIEGVLFADLGSAWNDPQGWNWSRTENGKLYYEDIFSGYGTGIRAAFFGFLWRIDVAWKYNGNSFSEPRYYWSFGLDF